MESPNGITVDPYFETNNNNRKSLGLGEFLRYGTYSSFRGLQRVRLSRKGKNPKKDGKLDVKTEQLYFHHKDKSDAYLKVPDEVKGQQRSDDKVTPRSELVVERINKIRPLSLQLTLGKLLINFMRRQS